MSACGNCRSLLTCNCQFEVTCVNDIEIGEFVLMPGVSGNYVSTPDADSPILSVTGDLDIRVKVAADDYTPAGDTTLVSKWVTTGNQRSYLFRITTLGELELDVSNDGTTVHTGTSTVALGFGNGSTAWLRVNFDADAGFADKEFRFYTSNDGVNWTKLGATVNSGGAISVFNSSADVEIGSNDGGTAELFSGPFYYAEIRRGPNLASTFDVRFDGDIIGVFDPKRAIVTGPLLPTTVDSQTGEIWTVQGNDWTWGSQTAEICTTVSGNGTSYAPINFRPNNVPLPRPYGHISRRDQFSSQTVAIGTSVIVDYTTSETPFNDGGMIDLAGDRLIAPIDGYYLVYTQVTFTDSPVSIAIIKTPSISPGFSLAAFQRSYTDFGTYSLVTLVDLAAGDYVQTQVANLGGGAAAEIIDSTFGSIPDPFPANTASFSYLWAQWERPL